MNVFGETVEKASAQKVSLESFRQKNIHRPTEKGHQMKVMNKKRFRKGSKTLAYRNKKAMFQFSIHYHRLACVSKRINARLASKLILKRTIEKNS